MHVQGCTRQTALEKRDLSCMYLAHHELKSAVIVISIVVIVIFIVFITIIIITIIVTIIIITIIITITFIYFNYYVQVPAGPTESEMECDASIRLGTVLSHSQQLEQNSNAELRAYLHMSAYLRLATQQRGVRCLSVCAALGSVRCKVLLSLKCKSTTVSNPCKGCPDNREG